MPFWKKASFDEQLQQLQPEIAYLNGMIGGYPTRIRNVKELQEVRQRWESAANSAQSLLKQRSDSVEAKYLLAELLRMGHNIDVQGAAQASHTLLKEITEAHPTHFDAHFSLATLYISIGTQTAPLAEQLFLKAESLAVPKIIASIYQGLGFACLYQNKTPDAIAHFEKYLQLQNDVEIRQLLDGLKSGKKFTIVGQDSHGQ